MERANVNYRWTAPKALAPGIYHRIVVRQVGETIEVYINDKKHYTGVGKLSGTITLMASGNPKEAIGIRSVAIKGTRLNTVPEFPSHLSHEAALNFGSWVTFQSDQK